MGDMGIMRVHGICHVEQAIVDEGLSYRAGAAVMALFDGDFERARQLINEALEDGGSVTTVKAEVERQAAAARPGYQKRLNADGRTRVCELCGAEKASQAFRKDSDVCRACQSGLTKPVDDDTDDLTIRRRCSKGGEMKGYQAFQNGGNVCRKCAKQNGAGRARTLAEA